MTSQTTIAILLRGFLVNLFKILDKKLTYDRFGWFSW